MTDPAPITAEPLRYELSFTTGPDYATRFTRAYYRYLFSRPRRFVPLLLILVIFLLVFGLAAARNLHFGSLLLPGVWLVFFVVLYGVLYFVSVRQVGRRVPPGSVFGLGFRSDTMVIRSPQVTSEVAYSLYKSCERRGRFVVLRQRISRVVSLLPAELFTDESFEFLRSKITPPAR